MTREQLWQIYAEKNPSFARAGERVVMESEGLKKLFDQTWDIAFKAGQDSARGKDFFDRIFGGKR